MDPDVYRGVWCVCKKRGVCQGPCLVIDDLGIIKLFSEKSPSLSGIKIQDADFFRPLKGFWSLCKVSLGPV